MRSRCSTATPPNHTFENDSRTKDAVATNKERARYYPKWLETGAGGTLPPINPQWPTNQFGLSGSSIAYWYSNQTTSDYFSLTSSAPTATLQHRDVGEKHTLLLRDSPRSIS